MGLQHQSASWFGLYGLRRRILRTCPYRHRGRLFLPLEKIDDILTMTRKAYRRGTLESFSRFQTWDEPGWGQNAYPRN